MRVERWWVPSRQCQGSPEARRPRAAAALPPPLGAGRWAAAGSPAWQQTTASDSGPGGSAERRGTDTGSNDSVSASARDEDAGAFCTQRVISARPR